MRLSPVHACNICCHRNVATDGTFARRYALGLTQWAHRVAGCAAKTISIEEIHMRLSHAAMIVTTLAGLGIAPTAAQARWEQLGCQKVGFTVDKDIIRVGRGEGRFKAIRLQVSGNKVHMMD